MPSPDLSRFLDLTVYDRDPTQLVDRALLDAQVKLPGWQPLEGNTEVTLIEAKSLIDSELVYAINRLPGACVEILLQLFQIFRDPGSPPTATVTFTLGDSFGHTIPAGTRIRLDLGSGNFEIFTTDAASSAAAGTSTITTTVTGQDNTNAANGVISGTALAMVDSVPFVDSAQLAATVAGGVLPEGDQDWLTRGVQALGALRSTLVLPADFAAAATVLNPTVERVQVVDNWDPTAGGGAGATTSGHVTVAVAQAAGALLSSGDKTTLAASLKAEAASMLAVHVVDPTITSVAVTASVQQLPGFTAGQVQANVIAALQAWLSPDLWSAGISPWTATVRRNDLFAVLKTVQGVSFVNTITTPASDVALSGVAPLTTPGAMTITVTGP